MPIVLGTPASTHVNSGTTAPLNYTCLAGHNLLLVGAGLDATGAAPPTQMLYNSVGMSSPGNHAFSAGAKNASWWYMFNPPTGSSLVIAPTFPTSVTGAGLCAISMSGVDTSRAPVIGAGSGASSINPTDTISGGGANDIYFDCLIDRSSPITGPGGNQVNLVNVPDIFSSGVIAFSADYILASNAGNFAWTAAVNAWAAVGLAVFAAPTGPKYITKWTPFRWACAMRSLQQGANNVGNRQQNRAALLASAITNANGAATWAKWRVGENSRVSSCGLMLNVPLVPGFVPPVGTVDDGT